MSKSYISYIFNLIKLATPPIFVFLFKRGFYFLFFQPIKPRKMYRFSLCTLFLIPFLFINSLNAQTEDFSKKIDVGIQLVAGSAINEALGLQGRAYYHFHEKVRVGINYTHYFDGFDASLSQKVIEWNADGHFILTSNDENIGYALAGFNYMKSTEAFEAFSYSEVGWNIGVGGRFRIGEQIAATAELKYIIGNANQVVLGVGFAYIFE